MNLRQSLPAIFLSALFIVAGLAIGQVAQGGKDDAEAIKIFKEKGCVECHSVAALKIEKKAPAEGEEKAEEAADGKKKKEAPDLSDVGLRHDAKFISNYIRKKADIDGEQHEKLFKGSSEERRAVATWLASLKHESKGDEKGKSKDKDDDKDDDEAEDKSSDS